jgi:hypothetical protein
MSSKFARRLAIQSCASAALMAFMAPAAYAQEQTYKFDIPAQDWMASRRANFDDMICP